MLRNFLCALLAHFLVGFAHAQLPSPPSSGSAPITHLQQDQRGTPAVPLVVNVVENQGDVAEKAAAVRHRTLEASNSRNTMLIAGAMLLVAAVQAAIFVWQLLLMRAATHDAGAAASAAGRSADAALLSQRPWVSCGVQIGGPLAYRQNGDVDIPLIFTLKNEGHSPAMGVRLDHWFTLLGPANPHPTSRQQFLAQLHRELPVGTPEHGLLLFPGATETHKIKSVIHRHAISTPAEVEPGRFFFPVLVGFVSYTHSLSDQRAQTGFVFDLGKIEPIDPSGYAFELDEVVPAENLVLRPHSTMGTFAT